MKGARKRGSVGRETPGEGDGSRFHVSLSKLHDDLQIGLDPEKWLFCEMHPVLRRPETERRSETQTGGSNARPYGNAD
jgi:hypothetical protein